MRKASKNNTQQDIETPDEYEILISKQVNESKSISKRKFSEITYINNELDLDNDQFLLLNLSSKRLKMSPSLPDILKSKEIPSDNRTNQSKILLTAYIAYNLFKNESEIQQQSVAKRRFKSRIKFLIDKVSNLVKTIGNVVS